MAFRVDTSTRGSHIVIACEGHLDAETMAAIERQWAAAEAAGLQAVIRVCRCATADRQVMTRLASYPGERLEVESPFLRSWLERLRAGLARTTESGS